MKTKTVTYEIVAKVIDEMHQAGEKITFRNVIARTGGAGASIIKYIKLWHEQRKILASGHTVSDDVLMAIIKESERVATHATEVANKRIKDLEAFIDGMEEAIAESEAKLEETDKLKQELLTYQDRNTTLDQELKSMQEARDKLLAENTAIKQQAQRALQDFEAMKSERNNLRDQANILNRDKQKIEQDVLIWRTKAEQLEQQLNTTFKDFIKK